MTKRSKNLRPVAQSNETKNRTRIVQWLKLPYEKFISGQGASIDFANAFVAHKNKFVDGICSEVQRTHLDNLVFFADSFISRMNESITQKRSLCVTLLGRIEMPKTDVVLRLSDVSSLENVINEMLPEGVHATIPKRVPRFNDEGYSFGYHDFIDMLRCLHDKDLTDATARISEKPAPEMPFSLNVIIHGDIDEEIYDKIGTTIGNKKFPISHECNDETVTSMFTPLHMGLPVSVRYDHPFYLDVANFRNFVSGLFLWNTPFGLSSKVMDVGDMHSIVITATFDDEEKRTEVFASRPTYNINLLSNLISGIIKHALKAKEKTSDEHEHGPNCSHQH